MLLVFFLLFPKTNVHLSLRLFRFTGPVGHMLEEEGILGEEAVEQARDVVVEMEHKGRGV